MRLLSRIRTGICPFGSVTFLLPSKATTITPPSVGVRSYSSSLTRWRCSRTQCNLCEHGGSTSTFTKATTTGSWLPSLSSSAVYAICGCGEVQTHVRMRVTWGRQLAQAFTYLRLRTISRSLHFRPHPVPLGQQSHFSLGSNSRSCRYGKFCKGGKQ